MFRRWTVVMIVLYVAFSSTKTASAIEQTFVTLDRPGATDTGLRAIDGNKIIGRCYIPGDYCGSGFLYDGSTFTTIAVPGGYDTEPKGISGDKIVGYYRDSSTSNVYHGFIYDGSTYTTFDHPLAVSSQYHGTILTGIDGNNITGVFNDSSGASHGFISNLLTPTTYTSMGSLCPLDISGNTVVGNVFIYDGSSYTTTFDALPDATFINLVGIDDDTIIGNSSAGSFLYKDSICTMLNYPEARDFSVWGISGNTIVGSYRDASYNTHGFIATIPEPSTFAILSIGTLGLLCYTWWRRWA